MTQGSLREGGRAPGPRDGGERRLTGEWAERDERFRQLVELAPDGILIHDGEEILWANAAALQLAGATGAEGLVGRPVDLLLDPPHLKAIAGHLAGGMADAVQSAPMRDTLRRLDGSTVQVEVRALVFIYRDVPAVHLVLRDITERLALEETARRVNEGLQQVMRAEALGTLAGGVAHELNNMIAIVLGHGAFALDARSEPGSVRADVREMMKAAERAADVTRQLLAFSQRAVHRPEVVDLGRAVGDMEPALARLLGPRRRLALQLAPVCVRVDPTHLAQVLLALATNARDATPEGGDVVVSVHGTMLSTPLTAAGGRSIPPGRFAELAVADSGTDIDPAVQSRMFEPFFTTKPLGQGIGLGLAAVQGILAQNDGFILAESMTGAGATFRVFLPEVLEPPVAARPARTGPSHGANARSVRSVLVVDDEPAIRSVVARILRKVGFEPVEGVDGVDALACIERDGPPDLVITDLQMPRMGGLELRQSIRARWPDLPVLLMSGYSADFLEIDGTIDEGDVLLQKPFTPGELMMRVASMLALTAAAGTSPSE